MGLFEAIRDACGDGIWSRGVALARDGAVIGESSDDDEIVLKVAPRGAVRAFTVNLWPDDEDGACDCPAPGRPCPHMAAAVIALKRAGEAGRDLPAPRADVTRLGYRFGRSDKLLTLQRVLVRDGKDTPLTGTLSSLGAKRSGQVLTSEADLAVEDAVSFRAGRFTLPRELVLPLLRALGDCPDIRLDGEVVKVSTTPIGPAALVEDDADGRGFRVRLVRDPRVSELFANGVVRVGDTLHPTGQGGLNESQRALLSRGVRFEPGAVGKLVGEMLPDLRTRLPVEVRTRRLPEASATPPRLLLELGGDGERLSALASLVYGDPPCARVDRGQLVLLGGPVPLRDEAAERELIAHLGETLGMTPGMRRDWRGEDAVRAAAKLDRLRGVEVSGGAARRFRKVEAVNPEVQIDGSRVSVRFVGAGGEADPARVLAAWSAGESLVPLLDGGWAPLPQRWLDEHGHRLADLLAARDPRGEVPKHAVFDLARLAASLNQPPPPALAGLRALVHGFEGLGDPVLPADLRAELRGYQRQGVAWLGFLRQAGLGGILADDMGLGKTLQALASFSGRTLVVAPTSVLPNWVAEAARFRPGLKVNLYHGPARRLDASADLTITSYALLRGDLDRLAEVRWDAAVLDEAQAIKNPESQVTQAAYRLNADFRLTLTGTPVENRLDELWSQIHFLNPGLLGGRGDFQERYAAPIAQGVAGAAARLRERIRPFVLRRLKREVAPELPPRTDSVLHCELSRRERAVYDAVRAATRQELVSKLAAGGGTLAALEALLRLRQAACHAGLVPGQQAEGSSKVDLLVETLEEVVSEGHKALVFSQWTSLLDRVEPHLSASQIPFLRLDGATRDRGAVVRRFQDEAGPPVLLISLKAGGTGLNLTAADHVFLLDPWWNPAVEEQAADRAHRIGQDRPVMVYRLVADDTVEERILALQDRKRALAEAALGGADQAAGITRAELLALLD